MLLPVILRNGGVGERLKPAVLKTVRLERVSGVRIPPPPPFPSGVRPGHIAYTFGQKIILLRLSDPARPELRSVLQPAPRAIAVPSPPVQVPAPYSSCPQIAPPPQLTQKNSPLRTQLHRSHLPERYIRPHIPQFSSILATLCSSAALRTCLHFRPVSIHASAAQSLVFPSRSINIASLPKLPWNQPPASALFFVFR